MSFIELTDQCPECLVAHQSNALRFDPDNVKPFSCEAGHEFDENPVGEIAGSSDVVVAPESENANQLSPEPISEGESVLVELPPEAAPTQEVQASADVDSQEAARERARKPLPAVAAPGLDPVTVHEWRDAGGGDVRIVTVIPERHVSAILAEAEAQGQSRDDYFAEWLERALDGYWSDQRRA